MQAGLRLCCSQIPKDRFSRVAAHILYLSNENLTCPSEQIMHKELSLALTLLIPCINSLNKNSMKLDINSIENSVDPGQLASSAGFPFNMAL